MRSRRCWPKPPRQGQTVVAASGDNGSEDCFSGGGGSSSLSVDTPADDANITGIGGTSLSSSGAEAVWNDCAGKPNYTQCTNDLGYPGGAGGGGLSALVDRPAWQPLLSGGTCTSLAPGGTCRQVPDVSANAGTGEVFRSADAYVAIGGTSIAAPKIAAIAADIDSGCTAPVGDLAPKLTSFAAHAEYGTALNDVTTGNNDLTRTHGNLYPGTAGADLATGVGTPIAAGWACPQVTSLSPTHGAAGSTVTITGFGLRYAAFKFGNTPATVRARTATSATVTVPAGSGAVTVRGTNTMGSGTHAVVFDYPDAVPRPLSVNTRGYRTVASDGGIFDFGGASFYGSTGAIRLNQPIVGMTTDAATGGYWFVARDGGVFGFHAPFLGSAGGSRSRHRWSAWRAPRTARATGSRPPTAPSWRSVLRGNFGSATRPRAPIVGIAATADGSGYWLAGRDGSIYRFGDAHDFGSMFGTPLARPIVGISADLATGGYWMVATDGGIFGFHAPFFGSTGAIRLNQPIVGIAPTANGQGLPDGGSRRRDLQLRERSVLRVDGWVAPEPAHGRARHCRDDRIEPGGGGGNRTRVQGFADLCLNHSATPPCAAKREPGDRRARAAQRTRGCGRARLGCRSAGSPADRHRRPTPPAPAPVSRPVPQGAPDDHTHRPPHRARDPLHRGCDPAERHHRNDGECDRRAEFLEQHHRQDDGHDREHQTEDRDEHGALRQPPPLPRRPGREELARLGPDRSPRPHRRSQDRRSSAGSGRCC